ncbi:MAG: inhibitor of cysteine peptidase [Acidobacteriota bacterium]|nr:inhibitor of cysteine peptidase [Acidobacteriota bacterium]
MAGMKTRKIRFSRLFFFVLVSVLLFVGVAMAHETEKEKKIFMMSDTEETAVTVHGIGEFSIKIKSNPTTGYSWAVQEIKPEDLVKFKEVKTKEPGQEGSQPPMLGAPTYEILTFDALKPGKAEIHLKYRRPWEKDVAPIKTHKVIVTIESL